MDQVVVKGAMSIRKEILKSLIVGFASLLLLSCVLSIFAYKRHAYIHQNEFLNIQKEITLSLNKYESVLALVEENLKNQEDNIAKFLDYNTYNEIFSHSKPYINLQGLYFIIKESRKEDIFSKFGKEEFVIFPRENLHKVYYNDNKVHYIIENGYLYILKDISRNLKSKNIILAKLNLALFVKTITNNNMVIRKLHIKNTEFYSKDKYVAKIKPDLYVKYIPQSFIEFIKKDKYILIFIMLVVLTSCFTSVIKLFFGLKRQFKQLYESNSKEAKQSAILKEKNSLLEDSITNMRHIFLKHLVKINSAKLGALEKVDFVFVEEVIRGIKSVFASATIQKFITWELYYDPSLRLSTEMVPQVYLVLLNILEETISRIPENGKISLTVNRKGGSVIFCIKDDGLNLLFLKQKSKSTSTEKQELDSILENIAVKSNITISRISSNEENIVEVVVNEKTVIEANSNVVHFPQF